MCIYVYICVYMCIYVYVCVYCAFSNYFQCRDSHVVTWMHMTSRLNTTRGSQWWQNNGVGVRLVTGARRPFKSKGQGAFQYSSLRFEVYYPSFWCCLRFLWACYQFHNIYILDFILYIIYIHIYLYIMLEIAKQNTIDSM